MKKAVLFTVVLALLLSLSVPVFAFSAQISAQKLSVNGKETACEKYNIDGSNYFKLRDLAQLLNGTGSQFEVGWDAAKGVVSVTTNHAYTTPNGHELEVGADKSSTAKVSAQTIMINGAVRTDLTVYNIGGSNFFKLREMGDALGFDVGYDSGTNTATVKSKTAESPKTEEKTENGIRPEFKKSMDKYEEFMKEYVSFMKKYGKSDKTDLKVITDSAEMTKKYLNAIKEFEKWKDDDTKMNTAELSYYLDVQTRVSKMLLEVADYLN
ncbi:MAG: hypothetical protein IJS65_04990 [Clostridia bacterium]|nr:hypothetical protein [Clostridia bacterium]